MHRFSGVILATLLLIAGQCAGQVRIIFKIDSIIPSSGKQYFFAGNINSWNPADTSFRFIGKELRLYAHKGDVIEYKITRGSWNEVECGKNGADLENRVLNVNKDTTVNITIKGWKNDFESEPGKPTVSPNVRLLDSVFFIPQLQRTRTVRIYLPPGYHSSSKRFPVLYMNDGQNCFDNSTSGYGEWHIDESLDRFYDSCKKSMIVVAVDHGETHRLQEYNPYDFKFGKGEGKLYSLFMAETLKPFIDARYRTLKNSKNTHIAGSSMGGLISLWTILAYPKVFGNAGIFSPAFWTAMPINKEAEKKLKELNYHSLFFYAGGNESESMVPDTKAMYRVLARNKKLKMQMYIDDLALHNEAAWSKWFPVYLQWILRN